MTDDGETLEVTLRKTKWGWTAFAVDQPDRMIAHSKEKAWLTEYLVDECGLVIK